MLKISQIEAEERVLNRCREMNYELVETFVYINNKTLIKLKCLKDGCIWEINYNNYINNKKRCSKCTGNKKNTQIEAETLVINRCKELNYELVEPFIYINNKSKIHLKCLTDNHIWYVAFFNFINSKTKFNKCSNNNSIKYNSLTNDYVINNIINKCKKLNYEIIEPFIYINNKSKIHLKCLNDGYTWWVSYYGFINNDNNCAKCSNNPRITQEEAEKNILERCKEMKYELIEPFIYKTNITKIKIMCLNDDNEWYVSYHKFINQKTGCPKCKKSKGEITIESFLSKNNIYHIKQKRFNECKHINTLPFDFYLPNYNICIEYDGEQHFKPKKFYGGDKYLNKRIKLDKIKNNYCKENNIKLIRIPYTEFKNIEDILKKELKL